jgi:hypothetical protein
MHFLATLDENDVVLFQLAKFYHNYKIKYDNFKSINSSKNTLSIEI